MSAASKPQCLQITDTLSSTRRSSTDISVATSPTPAGSIGKKFDRDCTPGDTTLQLNEPRMWTSTQPDPVPATMEDGFERHSRSETRYSKHADSTTPHQDSHLLAWAGAGPTVTCLLKGILGHRSKIRKESQRCRQIEDANETKLIELLNCLGKSNDSETEAEVVETLERLFNEFQLCRHDFKKYRKQLEASEDHLSKLEYHLMDLEQHIYKNVEGEFWNEECYDRESTPSDLAKQELAVSTPSNISSVILDQLYSFMGDMRVYEDRLMNLVYDQSGRDTEWRFLHKGTGERQHGITRCSQSDTERSTIQKDFLHAQHMVHELKNQCKDRNIQYESPILPATLDVDDIMSFVALPDSISVHSEPVIQSSSEFGDLDLDHPSRGWWSQPTSPSLQAEHAPCYVTNKMKDDIAAAMDSEWVLTSDIDSFSQ